MFIAAGNYASILSQRVSAERLVLAGRWLERLKALLTVAPNDVFPSDQLLDHIPVLAQRSSSPCPPQRIPTARTVPGA